MKKYLLLLAFSLMAFGAVNAATFTYSSVSPAVSGIVGNYDTIKIKFATPIKANLNNTTFTRGTINVNGILQYSRSNNFYFATSGAVLSSIVRINPSDNTELQILLKDCTFENGGAITITVGARSVYTLDNVDNNVAFSLNFVVDNGPTKYLSPANNGLLYGASDSLIVGCNANVYFSEDPALYFEITNNGTSIWKKSSAEFVANNLGTIVNNKLYVYGYPALTNGATYKATMDPGFLITFNMPLDGPENQEGVPLDNWVFTANFVTATAYSPTPGNLTSSNTSALNITFDQSVQIETAGKVEIWNYVANTLAYSISSAQMSLTNGAQTLVIPHTALVAGKKYFVKISSTLIKSSSSPSKFSGITNMDTWSFTTDVVRNWVGGTNTDWNTATNWSGGTIPVSGGSVKISGGANPCVISSATPLSLNNLTIEPTGKLTISAVSSLTLTGDFTMFSQVNTDLQTMSNNSSCLINGTLNVDPSKVYIYQDGESSIPATYLYSSPVTSTSGSTLGIPALTNIYKYDNPTAAYTVIPNSQTWEVGRGYATKLNQPIVFTGAINNNSSYFLPAAQSLIGGNPLNPSSYNMLGNPYTAAISWLLMVDTNKVYPTTWIWGGTKWVIINSLGGGSVTGSNDPSDLTIPRGHGFFVRAVDGFNGDLEIKKSYLVTNSNSHLKSSEVLREDIRLTAINGEYKDDILIGFHPEAKNEFEFYDSEKLNYPNLTNLSFVQIASFADGYAKGLAINTKPEFVDNMSYRIEMVANASGIYDLELTSVNANLANILNVFLVDSVSPTSITSTQLNVGDKYSFSTFAKVDSKRFKIVLVKQPTTGIKENATIFNGVNMFYSNNVIFINSKTLLSGVVSVYDIQSALIKQERLNSVSAYNIPFSNKGIFIVRFIGENGDAFSKKIIVN